MYYPIKMTTFVGTNVQYTCTITSFCMQCVYIVLCKAYNHIYIMVALSIEISCLQQPSTTMEKAV